MRGRSMVLAVAAAAVLVAHPASADAATKTRYVASNVHTVATALAAHATGVAVQGNVRFVPASDRITLKVNDAMPGGSMRVVIVQSDRSVRSVCVRDNVASTVTGLTPGILSSLWIIDATGTGPCRRGATTGTLVLRN